MRRRRLPSSFSIPLLVTVLGCNTIVGTEDIDYVEPETELPDDPETPPPGDGADSGGVRRDAGVDAEADGRADVRSGDSAFSADGGGDSDPYADVTFGG